ncbi:SPFH domain-containing protein [Roseburia hominis]
MAIAEVIKFEGDPNQLVWKHPAEDFNTLSQLIVDETHEALFVINGNAADLFGPGRRTLSTSNIPLLRNIIEIPTGGATPFPCKVFFINKVHQMDMKWGTQSSIPLEDPLYDIFMHVMLHGSISISVDESRKFMLKMVGFRDRFDANNLVAKFRGIISSHVKDAISKIMIEGQLSYFMISSHLLEISNVVKERLDEIFEEYGVRIEFFNIEAIEVPDKDYAEISQAKKLRSSRLIQGYTWQEERQMMIAEKFAANEGSMGMIGGVIGGAAGGIVMGNTISEVARNALSAERVPKEAPPKNVAGQPPVMGVNAGSAGKVDVQAVLKNQENAQVQETQAEGETASKQTKFCPECGMPVAEGAKFCSECGHKLAADTCPGCKSPIKPGMKFCPECGTKLM